VILDFEVFRRHVMTSINSNTSFASAQTVNGYAPRMPEQAKAVVREAGVAKVEAPVAKVDPVKVQNDLRQVVAMLNQNMEKLGRNLGFAIDQKAGRTVVTVTDRMSGDVIRQIPDESVLRMAHSIADMRGLFLNKEG